MSAAELCNRTHIVDSRLIAAIFTSRSAGIVYTRIGRAGGGQSAASRLFPG